MDGTGFVKKCFRVGLSEFSGLVSLADVVLDPFPVGGGRSSFEILAVGTPIVMLYNRTSILQVPHEKPPEFLHAPYLYHSRGGLRGLCFVVAPRAC